MKKLNFSLIVFLVLFFVSCSKKESETEIMQSKFLGAYKTTRSLTFVDKAGTKSQVVLSKTKVKIDAWLTDDSVSVWIGQNSTFRAKVGDSLLINVKDKNILKPNLVDSISPSGNIKANIVGFGVIDQDGKTLNLNYQITYGVVSGTTTFSETFTINEQCSRNE